MIWISNKDPLCRCYADGRRELKEDVEVIFNGIRFTIRKDVPVDGSSIPRFFWRFGAPTTGPNLLAGIIHDILYTDKFLPRDICDKIFYEALIYLGKPKAIAWLMYKAVRIFGKKHYK